MIFKDLAEQDLVGTEAVCVCCVPENASAGNILVYRYTGSAKYYYY